MDAAGEMRAWSDAVAIARSDISPGADAVIDRITGLAPVTLDLTNTGADVPLENAADLLVELGGECDLDTLDVKLAPDGPLAMRVAVKLAQSKRFVVASEKPRFVSVVFAVYQEHERILTRDAHPAGEDFLKRKLQQMRWLFSGEEGWELIVVDDGCPDGSGLIAGEIIEGGGHQEHARVLFLQDAIDNGLEVAAGLGSPADSRKGGSILYGMWDALQTRRAGHAVVFTDADLSSHLGQCGLLLEALSSGASCAAGSRREATSAVVKASGRNDRGKLFIYLWKQLLRPLGDIIDTQCGFKAFDAEGLEDILIGNVERRFAFDIELLLRTRLGQNPLIRKVPISWIDSEALSTTTDIQPYVPMLQAIAQMYRRYLPADRRPDGFAQFVDLLDDEAWARLLDRIPTGITSREPGQFAEFSGVTATQLALAAGVDPPSGVAANPSRGR